MPPKINISFDLFRRIETHLKILLFEIPYYQGKTPERECILKLQSKMEHEEEIFNKEQERKGKI